jgi:hypothetical protein
LNWRNLGLFNVNKHYGWQQNMRTNMSEKVLGMWHKLCGGNWQCEWDGKCAERNDLNVWMDENVNVNDVRKSHGGRKM